MRNTTLVIMAAGIGSRFGGGIKQLEPVGPGGEIIMDYSIYDALQAGFDKVVFIIRKDLEKDFREVIGDRVARAVHVEYAFQELDRLPDGYTKPSWRTKPWGTGQAVLAAKGLVNEPFLVINADDYYGKEGFRRIHEYMANTMKLDSGVYDMCMGGFMLANTLSENGGVTRGVCTVDADGVLTKVAETYEIYREGEGLHAVDDKGNPASISLNQHVSMNMWGLPPSFLDELERGFPKFLSQLQEGDNKSEYLLPRIIDGQIRDGKAVVKVLETPDKWFGVTYREDKETVTRAIQGLIESGAYPDRLFK